MGVSASPWENHDTDFFLGVLAISSATHCAFQVTGSWLFGADASGHVETQRISRISRASLCVARRLQTVKHIASNSFAWGRNVRGPTGRLHPTLEVVTMKKSLLATLVAGSILGWAATASADQDPLIPPPEGKFIGNVTFVTEYWFRGLRQTNN